MLRGTVKWFNKTKGYGFIAQANGEKDVFVHITQVQKIGLNRVKEIESQWFSDKNVREMFMQRLDVLEKADFDTALN